MVAAMLLLPSKAVLDTIDEGVKVCAVVVGGVWTYLNYRRGRTFRMRLEIDLTGSIGADGHFFLGECLAKNVGLSQVTLQEVGTGVSVYALWLVERADGTHRALPEEVIVLPLFPNHGWIEPGEEISDPLVVALPLSPRPLMGVQVAVKISNGKTVWNASKVFEYQKPKKEEGKQDAAAK